MARVALWKSSFNGGVWSPLMAGRIDVDKYSASVKDMLNAVATPQGPFLSRSGLEFQLPAVDEARASALRPFVFSNEQAIVLELGDRVIRFLTEDGVLTYAAKAVSAVTPGPMGLSLTVPGADAGAGDHVTLSGFPGGLDGQCVPVLAVAGNVLTVPWPHGLARLSMAYVPGMSVSRVFTIASPYAAADVENVQLVQSVDDAYLYCDGYRPRRLRRAGLYDWTLTDRQYIDGPFMPVNTTTTRLSADKRGNVPTNAAAGSAFGDSGALAAFDDAVPSDYYQSASFQSGQLGFHFTAATRVKTYTIVAKEDSSDATFAALDYAPSTWTFEASNNGVDWTILDEVRNYVLWENGRSVAFKTNTDAAWFYYRINVTSAKRNGGVVIRIKRLVFGPASPVNITVTASAVAGLNTDAGFKATDAGRLLRLQSADGSWRPIKISQVVSTTQVIGQLQLDEPLPDVLPTSDWRLGAWCDTTGWPICGHFSDDRLYEGGAKSLPDTYAASVTEAYDTFSPTDASGNVQDDSGFVNVLNARKLARIRWIDSDERGLLIGTEGSEWVVAPGQNGAIITARSAKARNATMRGTLPGAAALKIDRQMLFIQRGGRTMREFAYAFQKDGYGTPSLSQFASHLGAARMVQIDYAAEPHSIVWVRMGDGTLSGLTYAREENVVGWHRHVTPFGFIESQTVIPSRDGLRDVLWLAIRREINGATRRYIETMKPLWDFGYTKADAWFVDSGLKYEGPPVAALQGLGHLEGMTVSGLADGAVFAPRDITDGVLTLDAPASVVVVGLGYDTVVDLERPEGGSKNGTSQGKPNKVSRAVVRLWDSGAGEVGVKACDEMPQDEFRDLLPRKVDDPLAGAELYTGDVTVKEMPLARDQGGMVTLRRLAAQPLPLNVVGVSLTVDPEDG